MDEVKPDVAEYHIRYSMETAATNVDTTRWEITAEPYNKTAYKRFNVCYTAAS
jgi:hypothetical protein